MLAILLLGLPSYSLAAVPEALRTPEVTVCFAPPSPKGCDPTNTITQTLGSARHQILIQAYGFTSRSIAKAITDAHHRGIEVRVILDKSNERDPSSVSKLLLADGIQVMIDSMHSIAHNKVMIVDGQVVITGSFNFTKNAEYYNAENVVVIRDPTVAAAYLRNWNEHLAHSQIAQTSPIAQSRPSADPELIAGQFVGNKRSGIFAWPGCGSFDTMAPDNRVVFANRQAAESAGFHPAKNCP